MAHAKSLCHVFLRILLSRDIFLHKWRIFIRCESIKEQQDVQSDKRGPGSPAACHPRRWHIRLTRVYSLGWWQLHTFANSSSHFIPAYVSTAELLDFVPGDLLVHIIG